MSEEMLFSPSGETVAEIDAAADASNGALAAVSPSAAAAGNGAKLSVGGTGAAALPATEQPRGLERPPARGIRRYGTLGKWQWAEGNLRWSYLLGLVTVLASLWGFSGLAPAGAETAKTVFAVALLAFVVSVVSELSRCTPPSPPGDSEAD